MQSEAEPMELCDLAVDAQPSPLVTPPPWAVLHVDAQTSEGDVSEFLRRFCPSQCRDSEVSWISVVCAMRQPLQEGDVPALFAEWQWSCQHGRASAGLLHQLARKYGVVSGKWMVFCSRDQVDSVWQKLMAAVGQGRLGPSAKVSPVSSQAKREHVICVYAGNYFDTNDIQRLRQELRRLGHTEKLMFKPDVYTHCGICSGNQWGMSYFAFED